MIPEEKAKLIKARLILAQQLLEEADVLPALKATTLVNQTVVLMILSIICGMKEKPSWFTFS
jgi:hypothetical protein